MGSWDVIKTKFHFQKQKVKASCFSSVKTNYEFKAKIIIARFEDAKLEKLFYGLKFLIWQISLPRRIFKNFAPTPKSTNLLEKKTIKEYVQEKYI